MRVFGLTTGADTAGINVGIKRAFDKYAPDWHVDSMVASLNYIDYPVDVRYNRETLQELYDAADVVHLHNTLHAHHWYDGGQGKPTVLMHHGLHNGSETPYPVMVKDAYQIGAVQVCSTLDMALYEPVVKWLPPPVDIGRMRDIRRRHYRHRRVLRVGHAPTDRTIKGTAAFEAAMRRLAETMPVEMVLIEKKPWTVCLTEKATVDVFFDQPKLGYGSNAIEAWAMGIPVIAGVAHLGVMQGMIDRWGQLPFYQASEDTLYEALRALVNDKALRAEYIRRGTAHVERWHDERVTVASLREIYASAPSTKPGTIERRWPKVKGPRNRRSTPVWRVPA